MHVSVLHPQLIILMQQHSIGLFFLRVMQHFFIIVVLICICTAALSVFRITINITVCVIARFVTSLVLLLLLVFAELKPAGFLLCCIAVAVETKRRSR